MHATKDTIGCVLRIANSPTPATDTTSGALSTKGAPSSAQRLIRDGLIDRATYDRMFAAETAAWNEIMGMDEAALDTELGEAEAAAIDAAARLDAGDSANRGPAAAPNLRIIKAGGLRAPPAAYRHHYRFRLAGVQDGLMVSRPEVEEEIKDIKRLLMASEECFLPDVFINLQSYLGRGQLLVVERLAHGAATLEGCIAYEHQDLVCPDGEAGGLVLRRVNVIRLLAVRDCEHRAMLAVRLCREAQLRGTVRASQGAGSPACIGTVGIILERNGRALTWASRLGGAVRVIRSTASAARNDPTLAAFRDQFEAERESAIRRMPYRFMVANRLELREAARYHMVGVVPYEEREDVPGLRFDYDTDDPCSPQVFKAATGLVTGDAEIWKRFALTGPRDATLWGPPPAPQMSLAVGAQADGLHYPPRAGEAA